MTQSILPHDDLLKVNLARMEAYYRNINTRNEGIFDLALLGLKSLTILNGGAIIALFALLGHLDRLTVNLGRLWFGFAAFGIGTTAALAALVIGYLAQNAIMLIESAQAEALYWHMATGLTRPAQDFASGNRKLLVAIVCAVASLAAFSAGAALSLASVSPA